MHCFRKFPSHSHVQCKEQCTDDISHSLQCRRHMRLWLETQPPCCRPYTALSGRTNLSDSRYIFHIVQPTRGIHSLTMMWCTVPRLLLQYSFSLKLSTSTILCDHAVYDLVGNTILLLSIIIVYDIWNGSTVVLVDIGRKLCRWMVRGIIVAVE
jgi:hypothetical protein